MDTNDLPMDTDDSRMDTDDLHMDIDDFLVDMYDLPESMDDFIENVDQLTATVRDLHIGMVDLNDANTQQIITRLQPRIHENILHLVSKRFHRLMLRSVNLDIHVARDMGLHLHHNYMTALNGKLSSIAKIHMLQVFSEWGTGNDADSVLNRFSVPTVAVPQAAVGEAFTVELEILRIELHDAAFLPVHIWDLTALKTLYVERCSRIGAIPPLVLNLVNLSYLHIDDCTRLTFIQQAPPNVHTLRITACPMLRNVPWNLNLLQELTTLELHDLALRRVPDMQTSPKLKSLKVSCCPDLTRIIAPPASLQTLIIVTCHKMVAFPKNMEFLFELETLELRDLPSLANLVDVSLFPKLQCLLVKSCRLFEIPTSLPVSLVHFTFWTPVRLARSWPGNVHRLVHLKTLNADIPFVIFPDISRLLELEDLVLWPESGNMSVKLPTSLQTLHIVSSTPETAKRSNGFPVNLGELTQLKEFEMTAVVLQISDWLQLELCADRSLARDGMGFRRFSVVNCRMPAPPAWIAQHVGLEHLDLSCNDFKVFPPQYANLLNLRSLSIGNNIQYWDCPTMVDSVQTIFFPDFVYALPKLETLNVSAFFEGRDFDECESSFDPEESTFVAVQYMQFERLTHLTSMDMSGNRFRVVPDGVSLLTNLVYLDISDNGFKRVQIDFSGMTRLETLDIKDNLCDIEDDRLVFVVLSETISDLRSLTYLDVSNNSLTALPQEIGRLQNLEVLNIEDCDVGTLPDSITQLTKLKTFNAADNALGTIIDGIGNMRSLTSLDLFNNEIVSVPDSMCDLLRLKVLWISPDQDIQVPTGFDAFIASSKIQYH